MPAWKARDKDVKAPQRLLLGSKDVHHPVFVLREGRRRGRRRRDRKGEVVQVAPSFLVGKTTFRLNLCQEPSHDGSHKAPTEVLPLSDHERFVRQVLEHLCCRKRH